VPTGAALRASFCFGGALAVDAVMPDFAASGLAAVPPAAPAVAPVVAVAPLADETSGFNSVARRSIVA
jgi:hypothetical protein